MHRLHLNRRLGAFLKRLASSTRGSLLPLFAISLVPMTFATGMTIDYAKAMRMRNMLQTAADAAAMAAVSKQMMSYVPGQASSPAYNPQIARETAVKIFGDTATRLVNSGGITIDLTDETQFSISVTDNPDHTSRTANVMFRAQSPNAFAKILQWASLPVNGNSSSTVSAGLYTDMYVVLDTSQSMGLAATDDDARKLFQGTKAMNYEGCTFGCHAIQNNRRYANDWIAKQVGARMRIDVLRDATVDIIQTAMEAQGAGSLYRFGLYRIGDMTSEITKVSKDLAGVKMTAAGITLGPNNANGDGDSNLNDVTASMYDRIESRGNGTSPDKPRAFLFIVTDGLTDVVSARTGGKFPCTYGMHCMQPMQPASCQRYKDNNVTVAIIYTTYKPVYANPMDPSDKTLRGEYTALVQKHEPNIRPSLIACASKGWFFEASEGPAIHSAMQQLFAQAMQTPILTN